MAPVADWGRREYSDSLSEMRRLKEERRAGRIDDTLVLVEHPPVITVGVQGDEGESLPPGVPVFRVERGGKSTYHGPGQLVGYPIVDLEPRGRDVRKFVHDVEGLVALALGDLRVPAGRVQGKRGVWVDGSRKIASVGIAVERWVTFHGFALNVSTDLDAFRAFHPCGFDGSVMTSVEKELGRQVSLAEAKGPIIAAWTRLFGAPETGRLEIPRAAPVTTASAAE
ncbi:MAG: lipoyl(octanoyl) transferase LipB [Candidatus Lutacidiplasmatales archaeon]